MEKESGHSLARASGISRAKLRTHSKLIRSGNCFKKADPKFLKIVYRNDKMTRNEN